MQLEQTIPSDFSAVYPSYRDKFLKKAEASTEARLAIRANTISQLQNTTDIETQAVLIDLLTQLADTAGWWTPPSSANPEQLDKYRTVLQSFLLTDSQMQELLPQGEGNAISTPRNPSLRNAPEDAYMQLAVQTAIFRAGFINIPGFSSDSKEPFLEFIRQNPEALTGIKNICVQAYKEWGNLSGPRIHEYIDYVAQQHQSAGTPITAESYKNAWENYHDEILTVARDYPVNTYSPTSPRHNRIFEKTISALQNHDTPIATIGDFGSGIGFGPLDNLASLMKGHDMPAPNQIHAFDIFPAKYVGRKEVDGIPLVYTQQDISNPLFTASTATKVDFAMNLSVLPHLRSGKRVDIIKGMLRKSPAMLIEGGIYGRNYWDEENTSELLPRYPRSEHNGYLFIKNQKGGLDFTPLSSRPIAT